MRSILLLLLLALAAPAVLTTGCTKRPGLVVLPDDAHSLEHYALGLKYTQQGRYLMAKESFELALATARNEDMRRRCELELGAVERAIKEQR